MLCKVTLIISKGVPPSTSDPPLNLFDRKFILKLRIDFLNTCFKYDFSFNSKFHHFICILHYVIIIFQQLFLYFHCYVSLKYLSQYLTQYQYLKPQGDWTPSLTNSIGTRNSIHCLLSIFPFLSKYYC